MRIENKLLVCGILLAGLAGRPLAAQKPSAMAASKSTSPATANSRLWRSETSGKVYRVRIEKDRFLAEWANVPPAAAKQGAYIRTECRRAGDKWIGTSRVLLPCALAGETTGKSTHTCRMTLRFEVDSISPERIIGGGETLRDFNCRKCEVRQTGWGKFVWVPKR